MSYRKNADLLEFFEFNDLIQSMKRVDNNTLEINLTNGTIIYRLHDTNIIEIHDGKITYNTGGYRTITTKDRMNKFTPLNHSIYQRKDRWYIKNDTTVYDFYEGITFNVDGDISSENKSIDDIIWNESKKEINNFVNMIDNLESIPTPYSGDCWYCLMVTQDNKTLGDASNNYSHLISHIKERYMHGSLILNALKDAGYKEMFISLIFKNDHDFGMHRKDTIKRALRKYLKKRLMNEKYYDFDKFEGI